MTLTLCSEQDIKDEAGAGASPTITASSVWITRLGERAEHEVCAETRRDWITDFASVSASTADLVKLAVVSSAAKKIVQYDTSGYYSRLEQETLLDLLTDNYNRAIKALAHLDANSIRGVAD